MHDGITGGAINTLLRDVVVFKDRLGAVFTESVHVDGVDVKCVLAPRELVGHVGEDVVRLDGVQRLDGVFGQHDPLYRKHVATQVLLCKLVGLHRHVPCDLAEEPKRLLTLDRGVVVRGQENRRCHFNGEGENV